MHGLFWMLFFHISADTSMPNMWKSHILSLLTFPIKNRYRLHCATRNYDVIEEMRKKVAFALASIFTVKAEYMNLFLIGSASEQYTKPLK